MPDAQTENRVERVIFIKVILIRSPARPSVRIVNVIQTLFFDKPSQSFNQIEMRWVWRQKTRPVSLLWLALNGGASTNPPPFYIFRR